MTHALAWSRGRAESAAAVQQLARRARAAEQRLAEQSPGKHSHTPDLPRPQDLVRPADAHRGGAPASGALVRAMSPPASTGSGSRSPHRRQLSQRAAPSRPLESYSARPLARGTPPHEPRQVPRSDAPATPSQLLGSAPQAAASPPPAGADTGPDAGPGACDTGEARAPRDEERMSALLQRLRESEERRRAAEAQLAADAQAREERLAHMAGALAQSRAETKRAQAAAGEARRQQQSAEDARHEAEERAAAAAGEVETGRRARAELQRNKSAALALATELQELKTELHKAKTQAERAARRRGEAEEAHRSCLSEVERLRAAAAASAAAAEERERGAATEAAERADRVAAAASERADAAERKSAAAGAALSREQSARRRADADAAEAKAEAAAAAESIARLEAKAQRLGQENAALKARAEAAEATSARSLLDERQAAGSAAAMHDAVEAAQASARAADERAEAAHLSLQAALGHLSAARRQGDEWQERAVAAESALQRASIEAEGSRSEDAAAAEALAELKRALAAEQAARRSAEHSKAAAEARAVELRKQLRAGQRAQAEARLAAEREAERHRAKARASAAAIAEERARWEEQLRSTAAALGAAADSRIRELQGSLACSMDEQRRAQTRLARSLGYASALRDSASGRQRGPGAGAAVAAADVACGGAGSEEGGGWDDAHEEAPSIGAVDPRGAPLMAGDEVDGARAAPSPPSADEDRGPPGVSRLRASDLEPAAPPAANRRPGAGSATSRASPGSATCPDGPAFPPGLRLRPQLARGTPEQAVQPTAAALPPSVAHPRPPRGVASAAQGANEVSEGGSSLSRANRVPVLRSSPARPPQAPSLAAAAALGSPVAGARAGVGVVAPAPPRRTEVSQHRRRAFAAAASRTGPPPSPALHGRAGVLSPANRGLAPFAGRPQPSRPRILPRLAAASRAAVPPTPVPSPAQWRDHRRAAATSASAVKRALSSLAVNARRALPFSSERQSPRPDRTPAARAAHEGTAASSLDGRFRGVSPPDYSVPERGSSERRRRRRRVNGEAQPSRRLHGQRRSPAAPGFGVGRDSPRKRSSESPTGPKVSTPASASPSSGRSGARSARLHRRGASRGSPPRSRRRAPLSGRSRSGSESSQSCSLSQDSQSASRPRLGTRERRPDRSSGASPRMAREASPVRRAGRERRPGSRRASRTPPVQREGAREAASTPGEAEARQSSAPAAAASPPVRSLRGSSKASRASTPASDSTTSLLVSVVDRLVAAERREATAAHSLAYLQGHLEAMPRTATAMAARSAWEALAEADALIGQAVRSVPESTPRASPTAKAGGSTSPGVGAAASAAVKATAASQASAPASGSAAADAAGLSHSSEPALQVPAASKPTPEASPLNSARQQPTPREMAREAMRRHSGTSSATSSMLGAAAAPLPVAARIPPPVRAHTWTAGSATQDPHSAIGSGSSTPNLLSDESGVASPQAAGRGVPRLHLPGSSPQGRPPRLRATQSMSGSSSRHQRSMASPYVSPRPPPGKPRPDLATPQQLMQRSQSWVAAASAGVTLPPARLRSMSGPPRPHAATLFETEESGAESDEDDGRRRPGMSGSFTPGGRLFAAPEQDASSRPWLAPAAPHDSFSSANSDATKSWASLESPCAAQPATGQHVWAQASQATRPVDSAELALRLSQLSS